MVDGWSLSGGGSLSGDVRPRYRQDDDLGSFWEDPRCQHRFLFPVLSARDKEDLLSTDYLELWAEEERSAVAEELRRLEEGEEAPSERSGNLRMADDSLRAVRVVTAVILHWTRQPDHILVLVEESSLGEGDY